MCGVRPGLGRKIEALGCEFFAFRNSVLVVEVLINCLFDLNSDYVKMWEKCR